MTRIFLIRHAEAEGNLYRFAHGQSEGLITPRGYIQIEQLKDRFINEKIDAVYSSDLKRTQTTATAITQPHNLPLNTTPKLREVAMGEWEETSWGDLEYHFPEMLVKFNLDPANWIIEGNELYEDLIARVTAFITEVAKLHNGETIALITHGFAIRSFLCRLMGYSSAESKNLRYCDNTAVALLTFSDGNFEVEYYNDNSHLKKDESTLAQQKWWRNENMLATENMRYQELDKINDALILAQFQDELGNLPSAEMAYMTFLGEKPTGLLGLGKAEGNIGEIKYLYLVPELRNLKFGVQLLGKAITEYRKQKVEYLRIKVCKDTPIFRLCKKHGFEVIEEFGNDVVLERNIRNW